MEHDYEKLGAFYLGRMVEPATGRLTDDLLLYDSRNLVTHGVIIGMTGSGKTGLGIGLIEEAAMDRIPVLAIDPKGDLANLLLTFPDLAPNSFRPWINEETARQKGLDPDAFAAEQANLWQQGLADWHQDGERIRRLREQVELTLYTPGSTAGAPVSLLQSFEAPPPALRDDLDGLRDRVQTVVTGLLSLLGVDAEPVRSRDHILISTILDAAWREGRNLDLGTLIQAIQQPAFTRLGVMELESFYPARERFALAMQLNALLASPGFRAWMEGDPLDLPALLYTPGGKPRVTIFSIAHLGEAERMFFVTMLLSAVLAWTRSQPGTTSLRALVYMDEVSGFFPPVANPPAKAPMLTLLKQARAYGVGLVLATQNPVDLDYKGLGNAGTWFIGRLQTARDKARVLAALEGAMAGSNPLPRADLDRMVSGLGKRVFLMHNVHRDAPVLFTTRWAMSYLAGPMTLAQLRALGPTMPREASVAAGEGRAGQVRSGLGVDPGARDATTAPPSAPGPTAATGTGSRPVLPPEIRQIFLPVPAGTGAVVYRPAVLASAEVRYSSARHGLEETRTIRVLVPLEGGTIGFSLDRAEAVPLTAEELGAEPVSEAGFGSLPAEASRPRSYDRWGKELVRWIQARQGITFWESKVRKVVSRPAESERDFRIRLADLAREERDAKADRLRARYEERFRSLEERLRRAEQAVERKRADSQQAMLSTGVAALGGVLGALFGSRRGQIGRASSAVRGAGRVARTRQEVAHAGETVEAVRARIAELEAELQGELRRLEVSIADEPLEQVTVRPALNAIALRLVALAWVPVGSETAA